MALTGKERQAAYVERLRSGVAPVVKVIAAPIPTTRKARLAGLVAGLRELQGEYQGWLDSRPNDYADKSDANAERVSEVESFIETMAEAMDTLADIEVPRIRID